MKNLKPTIDELIVRLEELKVYETTGLADVSYRYTDNMIGDIDRFETKEYNQPPEVMLAYYRNLTTDLKRQMFELSMILGMLKDKAEPLLELEAEIYSLRNEMKKAYEESED